MPALAIAEHDNHSLTPAIFRTSNASLAINEDPGAWTFAVSGHGIVGDLFEATPQLTAARGQGA